MKFLKQFEGIPDDLSNQYSDIFMLKNAKDHIDVLKPNDQSNRNRANTYMENTNGNYIDYVYYDFVYRVKT